MNTVDIQIDITNALPAAVDIYEVQSSPDSLRLTYEKRGSVPAGGRQAVSPAQSPGQLLAVYAAGSPAAADGSYYLFPLASLNYTADQAWSIGAEDPKRMKDTFRFIQYTQANADSLTTQGFLKALSNVKDSDKETAVNKFFKGTQTFATCTWASWVVMSAWQAQFFSAWQNTYYLYSAPANKPAQLVATLQIAANGTAQDATATLQMADPDGRSEQLQMVGDGKIQEQNPGANAIAVTLTPVWMNVVQLSGQSFIDGAISGVINQEQVTGTRIQLPVSPPSTSSGSPDKGSAGSSSSGPSDQTKFIVTTVMTVVSAAVAISGLGFTAATYYYNPNRRAAANGNGSDASGASSSGASGSGSRADALNSSTEVLSNMARNASDNPSRQSMQANYGLG